MYTRTHEILRPRVRTEAPGPSTSGASDEFVFVRVGLADRAFDEIGDVKAIAGGKCDYHTLVACIEALRAFD